MKARFAHYNLELEEVLIGTPTSSSADSHIDTILAQLRQRQLAEEQVETFAQRQKAAAKERELNQALALAERQRELTGSRSSASRSRRTRAARSTSASGSTAAQIRALAEAEADRAARVGVAQAIAVEEQVRAYGGPRYQVAERARASPRSPRSRASTWCPACSWARTPTAAAALGVYAGETLLATLLSDKLAGSTSTSPPRRKTRPAPRPGALRASIEGGLCAPKTLDAGRLSNPLPTPPRDPSRGGAPRGHPLPSHNSIEIRWATADDAEALASVDHRAFRIGSDASTWVSYFREHPGVAKGETVMALSRGRHVGNATSLALDMAVCGRDVPCAAWRRWSPAVEHRRQGVADAMLRAGRAVAGAARQPPARLSDVVLRPLRLRPLRALGRRPRAPLAALASRWRAQVEPAPWAEHEQEIRAVYERLRAGTTGCCDATTTGGVRG
ncbi:MAG: GNAT family N-acetyltransferase [Polyangiales bacterium]